MRLISLLVLTGLRTIAVASAVHELAADTLPTFIAEHELSLISFDAPWCVHSQELAPEFASAAATLQDEGSILGHVDCEIEADLCNEYQIAIYPTIKIFHGKDHSPYDGMRKANAMVSFVRRHSHPEVTALSSIDEVEKLTTQDKVVVLGYLDGDDDISVATFSAVARSNRGKHLFGSITNDMFGRIANVQKSAVLLLKSFDEGRNQYTGDFDEQSIEAFIHEAASPLISELGVDLRPHDVFAVDITVAFIFAQTEEERSNLRADLRSVAEASKAHLGWVIGDPIEHTDIASKVALGSGQWPAFAIRHGEKHTKFAFNKRGSAEDLNENAIANFVEDFLADRLQPTLLSEPLPASQNRTVIKVVADSFNEVVFQDEKDVLVLYYSPTCGHCEAMKPAYEELGDLLEPYAENIRIAKIDATANDVSPEVISYPTLELFKSGFKEAPIAHEGERTAEDFLEFLENNGSEDVARAAGNVLREMTIKLQRDEL